ncbi:MAG: 4-(cytidine 5'-diphospho)-2-C-methyl-D-erythritol kinase [Deltaproteobacteria bacterium GWB2_65_81]|nr:MAG: 4-(cytidine 5'-diphospho)-2-C-methyl-D-erythritol kinase [Deltaproteobacteria bacterium GWB2_65_81]
MGTSAVSFLAPAKLNLSLQVFGKRPDGYHSIRSVMVPVSLYDEVTVEEAPAGIAVECDAPGVPTDEMNSCHRAAALFLAWAGTPAGVRIRICKSIPAESGLGGGSSDAAATLKGLIALTGLQPPREELYAMAARIGADVPFFLSGGAALVEGFGERVIPLPWGVPFHAAIVRPAFGLSTREGYARLGREPGDAPPFGTVPSFRTFSDVAAVVRNDFEAAWEPAHPEIAVLRRELISAGAAAAGLSGSGSAVFGLFASEGAVREARRKLSGDGDGGEGRRIFVARSI